MLEFAWATNLVREVKGLFLNFKRIALQCFKLKITLIWIDTFILL